MHMIILVTLQFVFAVALLLSEFWKVITCNDPGSKAVPGTRGRWIFTSAKLGLQFSVEPDYSARLAWLGGSYEALRVMNLRLV